MSDFTSLENSTSVAFRPNGIYRGIVTRVDTSTRRVWVTIPRVSTTAEFGWDNGLPTVSLTLPNVNDMVGCVFTENRAEELVVVGTFRNSSSLLYTPPVTCTSVTRPDEGTVEAGTFIYETDTAKVYVWDGTDWVGLRLGGTTIAGRVYLNEFGVGVGAESTGQSITVETPLVYQTATLSGASAGRSGLARIGSSSANHILIDSNVVQAKTNTTTAGELRLNPLGGQVTVAGTLQASTLLGAINAALLTSGTVPEGRMNGSYSGVTSVGTLTGLNVAGLIIAQPSGGSSGKVRIDPAAGSSYAQFENVAGALKLSINVSGTLTEVFRATADATGSAFSINSSNISLGTWSASGASSFHGLMATHSDGKRYYLAMAQPSGSTAQSFSTYLGARPGGYVYIRPDNNNSNRQFVLTNSGNWNGVRGGGLDSGHVIYGRLTFRSDGVTTPGAWFSDKDGEIRAFLGHKDSVATGVGFYSAAVQKWVFEINDTTGKPTLGVDAVGPNGGVNLRGIQGFIGGYTMKINPDTGIVFHEISRAEYKKNIDNVDNCLDVVDQLQPRSYVFKGETFGKDDAETYLIESDQRIGFIVEEVAEVSPHLVEYGPVEDKFKPLMWRETDMIALSVAAIKELKAQVELLEQRIDELES